MVTSTKSKISLTLGISGLVCNLLLLTFSGAPVSVACGIMGIAFALTTKQDGKLPRVSKIALILNIIALVFGLILFAIMLFAVSVLSDPIKAHQVLDYMEQIIVNFPPDIQQQIHSLYGI